MNDNKTLIRSSIISLVIVILGLFILCVGRSPRIVIDEPLITGSGFESNSDELSESDFLNLLESSDNEVSENNASGSLAQSILTDDNLNDAESEDDLAEILQLLEISEEEASDLTDDYTSELDTLLFETESETKEASADTDGTSYASLNSEINRLEKALDEKNLQIDNIQQEINQYDEQITQLQGPGGAANKSIKLASYTKNEQSNSEFASSGFGSASTFQEQYDLALSYFKNKQYQSAEQAFGKLLQDNPNHELADNCQHWIGECEFARGNYFQAIVEFEKVFSFDAPDKKDDAQIMLGLAYMRAGRMQEAKDDLYWFLACYQQSEYYRTAQRYINGL